MSFIRCISIINDIAEGLVRDHLSDPLVCAAGASADDADMFDATTLRAALREAHMPADLVAVAALRETIRAQLVREVGA